MNRLHLGAVIGVAILSPGFCCPTWAFKIKYDSRQEQSFTPPHKKQRRGKLKRAGR